MFINKLININTVYFNDKVLIMKIKESDRPIDFFVDVICENKDMKKIVLNFIFAIEVDFLLFLDKNISPQIFYFFQKEKKLKKKNMRLCELIT